MYRLTDNELIEELQDRLEENKRALHDLRILTQKLSDVNKKLQESEQLKSNFISNIRNEIINPLTSIMALSTQIAEDYRQDASLSGSAEMIHAEAFNLDMQLRNIFTAAEIEAGELFLSVSKLDVLSLVNETIRSFGRSVAKKRLKVNVTCQGSVCASAEGREPRLFSTDAAKLQIIFLNLIGNAVEYSEKDKGVDIALSMDNGSMALEVRDYGPGIEDSVRGRIFDRFRQAEEGMTKAHRGHGLGLSITKSLVEFLHGSLSLSTAKGKGSAFTVIVPEAAAEAAVDVFSDDGNEFVFEGDEEVL